MGVPYFGVLIMRILLCRHYIFSETPTYYGSLKASLTSWLGNRDLDTEVETVRHYKAGDGHVIFVCPRYANEETLHGHLVDPGRRAILLTCASQILDIFGAGRKFVQYSLPSYRCTACTKDLG